MKNSRRKEAALVASGIILGATVAAPAAGAALMAQQSNQKFVVDGKSVIHVYPGVPNNTHGRKNGIVGNHHRMVFKAKSPTAELVISDEAPAIPARTYHGQPFAPADPAQKRLIFNFVQVTELLDETVEK